MKTTDLKIRLTAVFAALILWSFNANAQYWQAANQLQNLITPALSGSGTYRGSVELSGLVGLGSSRLHHVEISTSQGYQYRDWFYMGAGMGVDIVRSEIGDDTYFGASSPDKSKLRNSKTGVMIPVFTDFRFNIAAGQSASVFIDLRLGASWLVGGKYLEVTDGYLTNSANFYLRPSAGVRIPVGDKKSKKAINAGLSYLLLTSGNNYWYADTQAFSSIGASVSFEW